MKLERHPCAKLGRLFLLVCASLFVFACNPQLSVVTSAPPNRIVRLDQDADRIEVSEGVAVAVECYRQGTPCKDMRATVGDEGIARVFPAHMSKLNRGYFEQGNVSTMTIVGLAPGKTKVRVNSERWTHEYDLVVHANTTSGQ